MGSFVDIHCHLLPGIDDGAKSWDDALAMARIACADGIHTIIATPHQLGTYAHNRGTMVRQRAAELQTLLDARNIQLRVLPGADVRIEPEMIKLLRDGEVLSLGDHRRHVLLELPHELYFPLEPVLDKLHEIGLVGILSHPERNQGLLRQRQLVSTLVNRGCLMQITAGSVTGTFGSACQQMTEWMLAEELVHVVATDAHGPNARRPLMSRAFQRIGEQFDRETAQRLCCRNPLAVAEGRDIIINRSRQKPHRLVSWFGWRKAA